MNRVQGRLADRMTRALALRPRRLSHEPYQPRQFDENLTRAEALRRIEALEKGNRDCGLVLEHDPKKHALGLRPAGHRFSLATNAERVCAEIMLKQKDRAG
jgi:hypothetical protein